MDINATLGKNPPNQVSFADTIGALDITANGVSRHVIFVDVPIPPTVDKTELAEDIVSECATNVGKMIMLASGTARVNFLGAIVPFSFGPSNFLVDCL